MKSALFFIAAFAAFASVLAHATKLQPASSRSTPRRTRTECQQASAGAPNWLGTSLGAIVGAAGGRLSAKKGKKHRDGFRRGSWISSGAALAGNGSGSPRSNASSGGQAAQRLPDQNDRGNTVFVPTYLMQAR